MKYRQILDVPLRTVSLMLLLGLACSEGPNGDDSDFSDIDPPDYREESLDSLRESESDPPPEGLMSGGGVRIAETDIRQLLDETVRQVPPKDKFDSIGYVHINSPKEHDKIIADRNARRGAMTLAEYERASEEESLKDETDSARMILVSADGRMYRERIGAFPNRPTGRTITSIASSLKLDSEQTVGLREAEDDDLPTPRDASGNSEIEDFVTPPNEPSTVLWSGTDGRSSSLTSSWPWRSFGSLRVPNTDISNCSGGMIAP